MSTTSKTLEYRGGASFEKTVETVKFFGASYDVSVIGFRPPIEAAVRVEVGDKDFQAFIHYDKDNS